MASDGRIVIQIDGDSAGLEKSLKNLGNVATKGLEVVTKAIAAVGTGLAAASGFAYKFGSNFESEMSNLAAITGMTTDKMKQMEDGIRSIALMPGAPSLLEIAKNAKMVAEAGGDMDLMMSQLAHGTNLAVASQTDMATTLDFVGSTMKTFGVEAVDTQGVVDSMALVTSLANVTLGQLGESYVNTGGAAADAGLSIDDVNAMLIIMSEAGLKGGAAGTSLNAVLRNLSTPTEKAAEALESLNVKLYDNKGASRDMFDIMNDLQESFTGLTDEERKHYENVIFDTVALKGWGMIASDGIDAIIELSGELSNASEAFDGLGQAAGMAAVAADNNQSRLETLKNTAIDLGISVYQSMQGTFAEGINFGIQKMRELAVAFETGGFEGLASKIGGVISDVAAGIVGQAPAFIAAAGQVIISFIDGIIQNIPKIGDSAMKIGSSIIETVVQIIPKIIELGIQLGVALIGGLLKAIPEIIGQFGLFGKAISVVTIAIIALKTAMAIQTLISGVAKAITAANAELGAYSAVQAIVTKNTYSQILASEIEAGSLGILSGVVAVLTGKMTLLAAAKALVSPVAIAVAAIGATIGLVALAYGEHTKALEEATRATTEYAESVKENLAAIEENIEAGKASSEAHKESIADIERETAANQNLITNIFDLISQIDNLADSEEELAEKKYELIGLIDVLNEIMPGLNLQYDEQANSIGITNEALKEYTDILGKQAKLDEDKARYTELLREEELAIKDRNAAEEAERDLKRQIADEEIKLAEAKERRQATDMRDRANWDAARLDAEAAEANLKTLNGMVACISGSNTTNMQYSFTSMLPTIDGGDAYAYIKVEELEAA